MTYTTDCTLPVEILEQIAEQGRDVLPELIRIVVNTAMQAERRAHLGVQPYERSPARRDHANGFRPTTVATRMDQITFAPRGLPPQVRKGDCYPSALERGIRSERALKLALAEMYVQGVPTWKAAAITIIGFPIPARLIRYLFRAPRTCPAHRRSMLTANGP